MTWRLLDLFSGAGGAAYGYMQAGFHVTGVDLHPQPRYKGDVFIQADALAYLAAHGQEYDVVHASPPCQAYSALKHLAQAGHPELIIPVRRALQNLRTPYVIENVVGAPLHFPLMLCGSMFDLETPCGAQLRRHRLFESNYWLLAPGECTHGERPFAVNGHEFRNEATRWAERRTISTHGKKAADPRQEGELQRARTITVTGSTPQQNVVRNRIRETFSVHDAQVAMGIDWMGMKELSQAIPPAYTRWIGEHLLARLAPRTEALPP